MIFRPFVLADEDVNAVAYATLCRHPGVLWMEASIPRPGALIATSLASLVASSTPAQQQQRPEPRTVAEASGFTKTSTHADVLRFLAKLDNLPHGDRLRRQTFGRSGEGRDLPLVVAGMELPADEGEQRRQILQSPKLRLLVNANIHAGEVEGKEAVQILLREIAYGRHTDLLEHATLLFVPDYNPDGNDRVDQRHRASQNGPTGGVGQRPNAAGYDLNRDFVKIDTSECRALLGVFRRYDPHLFMDLHTTNGSYHGYHLTYAPALATNVDPELRDFARKTLLPEIRTATEKNHGFRVYDYGNFPQRNPDNGWATYDHRPRFGTNYYGLRNRFAVLSEAYSYVAFRRRVACTRAFVLETLRAFVTHASKIKRLCQSADRRLESAAESTRFGYASRLEEPWEDEVLIGSVERERIAEGGWRLIAGDDFEARRIPVQTAFVATRQIRYPRAWAIPNGSDRTVFALLDHGVEVRSLAEPLEVKSQVFEVEEFRRRARPYQNHREVSFEGKWRERRETLPRGTLFVAANQRLARVAAQLLEPQSEDSLATWNYFDDELEFLGEHPVVRVTEHGQPSFKRVLASWIGGKRVRVLK